jgi:hypothetical protein
MKNYAMEIETKLQAIDAQLEAIRARIEAMKAIAVELARSVGCEEKAQGLKVVHKAEDKKSATN